MIDDREIDIEAFETQKGVLLGYEELCNCPDEPCLAERMMEENPTPTVIIEIDYDEDEEITNTTVETLELYDNENDCVLIQPPRCTGGCVGEEVWEADEEKDAKDLEMAGKPDWLIEAESTRTHTYELNLDYRENEYYLQLTDEYKEIYDELYHWCDIMLRHRFDVIPCIGNSYYVDYISYNGNDFEAKKEFAIEFIKENPQFFFIESLEYYPGGRLWLKMYDGYENGEARVAEAERRTE